MEVELLLLEEVVHSELFVTFRQEFASKRTLKNIKRNIFALHSTFLRETL